MSDTKSTSPRVRVRKDQHPDAGPYPWHYSVEWETPEPNAMDYGSLATWEEALASALASLASEDQFRKERDKGVI